MTAPARAAAPTGTAFGANSTSWVVTLPATTSGRLRLIYIASDGTGTPTTPTGYTLVRTFASTASRLTVFGRVLDGSEGATLTITMPNESGYVYVEDYTGHGVTTVSTDVKANGDATGTSTAPNALSMDPGSAQDWLYKAVYSQDTGTPRATAAPAGYSNLSTNGAGGSTGANIGMAEKAGTAQQAEDAGAFTANTSVVWATFTVAIPPVAGGGATATITKQAFTLAQKAVTGSGGATQGVTKQAYSLSQKAVVASGGATTAITKAAFALSQKAVVATGGATKAITKAAFSLSQKTVVATGGAATAIAKQAYTLTQQAVTASAPAIAVIGHLSFSLTQYAATAVGTVAAAIAKQAYVLTQNPVTAASVVVAPINTQHFGLNLNSLQITSLLPADMEARNMGML